MNNVKQILLLVAGIIFSVVMFCLFFYVFIFIAGFAIISGLVYYIYNRFFRKRAKPSSNKKVGPIIIDMEDDK